MTERLPWFRCFPTRLLANMGALRPDDALTYIVIILRCHEHGGPIPDQTKTLARITGLPPRRVERAVQYLKEIRFVRSVRGKLWSDAVEINRASPRPPQHEWAQLRDQVFARDDYTCRYCGSRGGRLECDHIVPVSKGGPNDPDNLATACRRCNRAKRDKHLAEWLQ